jgi:hypothetical protein
MSIADMVRSIDAQCNQAPLVVSGQSSSSDTGQASEPAISAQTSDVNVSSATSVSNVNHSLQLLRDYVQQEVSKGQSRKKVLQVLALRSKVSLYVMRKLIEQEPFKATTQNSNLAAVITTIQQRAPSSSNI